ncbi:MAG: Rieske 2Fe-2S domain-containing protein [Actinomycetota bacterium]|nr:Rieske 2Fe-2S domain-containing protein [Actinomycetota bacterium]
MRGPRLIAASFVVSMLASIALVVLYAFGGDPQLEGVFLGVALGALGLGIVVWAIDLLYEPEQTEEREAIPSPEEERNQAEDAFDPEQFTRRKMLVRLLGAAVTTVGAALAVPALSLGPRPGQDLFRTRWTSGARVVDADGSPIRPEDLPLAGVTTVFPEGHEEEPDSQTLLLRVEEDALALPEGRSDWAPQGCLAYSKICTHAGCPVGLYRAEAGELLCPCHQSTFDVYTGAVPVFGPAARPLPQLPLDVNEEGFLVARGDFSAPVGPSFWNLESNE